MKLILPSKQTPNASKGGVRFQWSGPKTIEFDLTAYARRIAAMSCTVMGDNLFKGWRPDGSGLMPARKKDGRPRGQGSRISQALSFRPVGKNAFKIAAWEEQPGHLKRILGDVPLKPPPFEKLKVAVQTAIQHSWVVKK